MIEHKDQVVEVLEDLDQSNFISGDCNSRALYCLLFQYRENIPVFDHQFHKQFEKHLVTTIPGVDDALWYLIRTNQTFWKSFERVRLPSYTGRRFRLKSSKV